MRRIFLTLLIITLVGCFTVCSAFAANEYYGESYALIIGVNQYKNWSKLDYPIKDCVGFQSTLVSYLGFKKKNILTLYNEKATKEAILNALMFRSFPKGGLKREDRLIIFFAGHTKSKKLMNKKYRGYIVPYDAYPVVEESSCISTKLIKTFTDKITSKHILLVVDACISVSGFTNSRTVKIDRFADYLKEATTLRGRQVFVAGGREDIFHTKGPYGFSLFTGNIIKGIKTGTADIDGDGFILGSELARFVNDAVSPQKKQSPHLRNIFGNSGGDMVFVLPDRREVKKLEKHRNNFFKREMGNRRKETMSLIRSMIARYVKGNQAKTAKKTQEKQKNRILSRRKKNIALVKKTITSSLSKRRKKKKFHIDKSLSIVVREKLLKEEIKKLKKEAKSIKKDIAKLSSELKKLEEKSPQRKHLPIKTMKTQPDGAEMVFVPAGEFIMGDSEGDYEEQPERKVTLSAFWIDRYEVTNKQYMKFCDDTGYRLPAFSKDKDLNGDTQPVTGISWDDSFAYGKWAKKRLPTEAEWEKAARGPYGYKYPWGNKYKKKYANLFGKKDGFKFSAPIGSFPNGASYYGCMDMAGNVWEWVSDYLYDEYYKKAPSKNPKGPKTGTFRVFRGGSWGNYYFVARTTARNGNFPYYRDQYIVGFRLVRDP